MTALATLLANPSQPIAFVVRFDERDPATDTVTTRNYQTNNRGGTEGYPAFLSDPGGRSDKLEADELAAIAIQTVAPVQLLNEPTAPGGNGPLDFLLNRTLAGRDITILAGHPSEAIANYEPVVTGVMDHEPIFDGSGVEIRIKSPLERLNVDLDVGTYVGEPGALRGLTSTVVATAAYNAAHDLTEFALGGRVWVDSFGSSSLNSFAPLSKSSGSAVNFLGSVRRLAQAFAVRVTSGAGATTHDLVSATNSLATGLWYWWGYAWRNGYQYLLLDGEIVAESALTVTPDTPAVGVILDPGASGLGRIMDSRIFNHYISPDEMRAAMAVRATGGESGLVGLWRCDDQTGSTLTDYSATGAHATIAGTEGVDFSHVSSDLGTAELAGRSMPAFIGGSFHVPADLVDPFRERWRISDGPLPLGVFGNVYDEGEQLSITVGLDYDWVDGEPVLQLTSEAGEPVTVGRQNDATLNPEAFFPQLLADRGPIDTADITLHRFQSLHTNPLGISTRRRPVVEILREAIGGGLGFVSADRSGGVKLDALAPLTSPSPRNGACLELAGTSAERAAVTWSGLSSPVTSANFTVACWAKVHRLGGASLELDHNYLVTSKATGASDADMMLFDLQLTSGVPVLRLKKQVSFFTETETGVGDFLAGHTDWWFLAAVHDATGSVVRFYAARDGEALTLIGTGVSIFSSAPPSQVITAGPSSVVNNGNSFYGSVFEPQIWNARLTLPQLQALMDAAPAGNEATLAFYSPLDGDSSASRTNTVSSTIGTTTGDVREVPDLVLDLITDPKIFRPRQQRPAHAIEVEYRRNFAVLDPANIAATVPQEEALDRQTAARFERWSDPDIAADHLDAREISIPSLWATQAGARAALRLARYRFAPGREQADLVDAGRQATLLTLGDEVRIYGSRWDLDEGLVYRVIANNARLGALTSDLVLWR